MKLDLPLSDIVNVKTEISAMSAPRKAFNIGLLLGQNNDVTQKEKVAFYQSADAMAEAGFTPESAEYQAAVLYFSQSPAPDILAVGLMGEEETVLEALQQCRMANSEWYVVTFTKAVADALDAEKIDAIAAYIESCKIHSVWFHLISDKDTYLAIMQSLRGKKYSRTLTMYSTDAAAATAALMGYAMGANDTGSTAYTLAHKTLVGVMPEADIDSTALKAILAANGNVYVTQGYYYTVLRSGKMANGISFDDVLYLDMLVNHIELAVMDQLTSLAKVPQTQDGVDILVSAITDPCEAMVDKGYLAPGVWLGRKVLNLEPGDTLNKGYQILSEDIHSQSKADRDARIAPPIYCCIKTAGAIESVTIGVIVDR